MQQAPVFMMMLDLVRWTYFVKFYQLFNYPVINLG
jgi:hypothetical protein